MHIQNAIEGCGLAAVKGGSELVAGDDPTRRTDQVFQNVVFDRGDGQGFPFANNLARLS